MSPELGAGALAKPPPLPLPVDGGEFDLRTARMTLTSVKPAGSDHWKSERLKDAKRLEDTKKSLRKTEPSIFRETVTSFVVEDIPASNDLRLEQPTSTPSGTVEELRSPAKSSRFTRHRSRDRRGDIALRRRTELVRFPTESDEEGDVTHLSGPPPPSRSGRPGVPRRGQRSHRTDPPTDIPNFHRLEAGDTATATYAALQFDVFDTLFDELCIFALIIVVSTLLACTCPPTMFSYMLLVGVSGALIFHALFDRSRLLHGCRFVCSICRPPREENRPYLTNEQQARIAY